MVNIPLWLTSATTRYHFVHQQNRKPWCRYVNVKCLDHKDVTEISHFSPTQKLRFGQAKKELQYCYEPLNYWVWWVKRSPGFRKNSSIPPPRKTNMTIERQPFEESAMILMVIFLLVMWVFREGISLGCTHPVRKEWDIQYLTHLVSGFLASNS